MDATYNPIKLIFSHFPDNTHNAFAILAQQSWLKNNGWYLAGGTALSLQCDHRVSFDLDFFTPHTGFEAEYIVSVLTSSGWITSINEKGTLYGELEGAKISFISYPYFIPKQPFITYENINILDAQDIAVMKIIAISQRGKKRDFFDLYWYLIHRESLIEVLQRVKEQYPNSKHNYHHILKSLTYFEEAEDDPDPQIFFDTTWEQVKKHFLVVVPEVAAKLF